MFRIKPYIQVVAGVSALAVLPFVSLAAGGADTNPTAWRFRTYSAPTAPTTVTVSGQRGHGWFEATDAGGKTVRVILPPKFGSVERDGQLIATEALRRGDQLQVWGLPDGGRLHVARAHAVTGGRTADRQLQLVSTGCCGARANCTSCGSKCNDCTSRAACQSCCGTSCYPSSSCCA
jgi:hypothetical protein